MRYFLSANKNMSMSEDPSLAFAMVLSLPNQRHDFTSTKMGVRPSIGSDTNLDSDLKAMIGLYPGQKIFLVFVCPYWEIGNTELFEVEVSIRKPGGPDPNSNSTDTNSTASVGKSLFNILNRGRSLYQILGIETNGF